jgi:serine/threonine-protein kinase LATS1/2
MDTALDLLHRAHALDVANHEVINSLASMGRAPGLTARNVAMVSRKTSGAEYSNGHHVLHRASPAINSHRSESPATCAGGAGGGPPALPPRSHHSIMDPPPPRLPPSHPTPNGDNGGHQTISRKYSPNGGEAPPPLPPPRGAPMPPPTPPRGTTPPPNVLTSSMAQYSNSPIATSLPPPLLKRMSPVPSSHASRAQGGVIPVSQRGTSPVTTHPLKVHNSREIQQQFQQQLQTIQSSIFPADSVGAEPPPPYPMGTAVTSNPPPSYSQSLAMRQSPTLSSTSSDYRCMTGSDYRRSPAPAMAATNHLIAAYQQQMSNGGLNGHHGPSPIPAPSPSPSMMSSSSRASSSMQAWGSRQAKTQSPVIMQSVKSTQVQKPVLQTATGISAEVSSSVNCSTSAAVIHGVASVPVLHGVTAGFAKPLTNRIIQPQQQEQHQQQQVSTTPTIGAAPPPPSYEMSIQQKQQQRPQPTPSTSPVIVSSHHNSPLTIQRTMSPSVNTGVNDIKCNQLPPPPPYPSSAVHLQQKQQQQQQQDLVSGSKQQQPVISTAKVVSSNNMSSASVNKPVLQRKYSPMCNSETTTNTSSSSASVSRSESPISENISSDNTVSCSPLSFNDISGAATITADSGIGFESTSNGSMHPPPPPPPYKTTHHTSPKPERRNICAAKEEARKSYIRNCPPQAFKFYMEQHIEKILKEHEERTKRKENLKTQLEITYGGGGDQNGDSVTKMDPNTAFTKEEYMKAMQKLESAYLRMKRAKLNKNDFKRIKSIGVGAFGEVSLVKKVGYNGTSHSGLYAMKTLRKAHVVKRKQVAHVIAEKDILAEANNDWIVKLHYSFQVSTLKNNFQKIIFKK